MDSAGHKVWILLGIALPKSSGDTHSTLMISWHLMMLISLFWKNSGVSLLIPDSVSARLSAEAPHTHSCPSPPSPG